MHRADEVQLPVPTAPVVELTKRLRHHVVALAVAAGKESAHGEDDLLLGLPGRLLLRDVDRGIHDRRLSTPDLLDPFANVLGLTDDQLKGIDLPGEQPVAQSPVWTRVEVEQRPPESRGTDDVEPPFVRGLTEAQRAPRSR